MFFFYGLIINLRADSFFDPDDATAKCQFFKFPLFSFFLWSEVAMVYPRITLGIYLITRKHKITKKKFFSISI